MCVYLSNYISIYLSIYRSIYPSIYRCIYPSIYLCIHHPYIYSAGLGQKALLLYEEYNAAGFQVQPQVLTSKGGVCKSLTAFLTSSPLSSLPQR